MSTFIDHRKNHRRITSLRTIFLWLVLLTILLCIPVSTENIIKCSRASLTFSGTQEPLVIPSISPSEGQFTPFSSGSKISNSYSTATTPYTSEPFNDCVDSLQIYNGSGDKNVLLVEDSTQPTAYGNFQTGLKSTLSSNDWQDGGKRNSYLLVGSY
jgi:hypothetical protein